MDEQPVRIDQAIAPAGLVRSAAAYSLFIVSEGVYVISTGPGWRLQFRGVKNQLMVDRVRRTEAEIDPRRLGSEVVVRGGSSFISADAFAGIELSRRFDRLPDLRFSNGSESFRFQFDQGREDDVEAFVEALMAMAESDSRRADGDRGASDGAEELLVDGQPVKVTALPSPCWGASPFVALADGWLFVQHLVPGKSSHVDATAVYRATEDEQAAFAEARLDVSELCRRLVEAAWGSTPDGPPLRQPPV